MNVLTSPKFEALKTTGRLPSPRGVARRIMTLAQKDDVGCRSSTTFDRSDVRIAWQSHRQLDQHRPRACQRADE